MKTERSLTFKFGHKQCTLRSICPDDVSISYVNAIKNDQYIVGKNPSITLSMQKAYVDNVFQSSDQYLIGLFVDEILIGSTGMQISSWQRELEMVEATMGILIFGEENRGRGYGKVLVWAGTYLMSLVEKIFVFQAGIESSNERSMRTFKSCGFQVAGPYLEGVMMELNIGDLKRPETVSQVLLETESDY